MAKLNGPVIYVLHDPRSLLAEPTDNGAEGQKRNLHNKHQKEEKGPGRDFPGPFYRSAYLTGSPVSKGYPSLLHPIQPSLNIEVSSRPMALA